MEAIPRTCSTSDYSQYFLDVSIIQRVCEAVKDVFGSAIIRVGSIVMISLTTQVWPFILLAGIGYAAYDWRKLALELSVMYHTLRYSLPDESTHEQIREGEWTFYRNTGPSLSLDPIGGKSFLDPIASHRGATLYLGALPMHSHGDWLAQRGVRHVISMIEDEEYDLPRFIGDIVKPEEWESKGIEIHRFPTPDLAFPIREQLQRASLRAQEAIENGESVYIHCKAGRGRAPSVATKALSNLTGKTLEELEEILLQARSQVKLDLEQLRL